MAVHRALDDLTPEQVEALRVFKNGESAKRVPASSFYTDSEKFIAELGLYYGWQAVRDALTGKISAPTMTGLVYAARAIKSMQRIELLQDLYSTIVNANTKNGDKKQQSIIKKIEALL